MYKDSLKENWLFTEKKFISHSRRLTNNVGFTFFTYLKDIGHVSKRNELRSQTWCIKTY